MNESGRSVEAARAFYKIRPEDVVVFHDEIDLVAGKVRLKRGGGHAGHNGLRSIHAHMGPDYARVRIGIGHPGDKDRVIGHVLKNFAKADKDWVEKVLGGLARHLELLIVGDDPGFMTKVAQDVKPPRNTQTPPELKSKPESEPPEDGDDGV